MNPPSSNYQKYTSENLIQRLVIQNFLVTVQTIVSSLPVRSIADIGCGEGFVLNYLRQRNSGQSFFGYDKSRVALRVGRKLHPTAILRYGSIYRLPIPDATHDLILCLEVLEHLEDPEKALRELFRVSGRYGLFSVPYEPWFRLVNLLRGKYLTRLGNHPEHINHWTIHSFCRVISQNRWRVLRVRVAFPWIVVLAMKQRGK